MMKKNAKKIVKKDMTFYLCSADDTRVQAVYFIGKSDVPYISLEDWGELYTYLTKEYINKDEHIGFSLTFAKKGKVGTLTREDGYTMTVDCAANTITFDDFDAFLRPESDRVLVDILGVDDPHSDAEVKYFRRAAGSYERYGSEVVLDLGAYGIDLACDKNACYVPIQTMSDFLLAYKDFNVFYNGEAVFFAEMGSGFMNEATKERTAFGEVFFAVKPKKLSKAMGAFSYAELCLALDNLYGLKDTHGIASFAELSRQTGTVKALMGTDPDLADEALYRIIQLHLDDRHSMLATCSPFSSEGLLGKLRTEIGYGRSTKASIEQYMTYMETRAKVYPDGVPIYEEIGNTAYITFDEFSSPSDDVDYYQTAPTADAEDTNGIMIYAYSQIMREDSPIENVVLDLSFNGGGSSNAAVFVISAFLGEGYASLRNTFSGALATGVYNVDIKLDRTFDDDDKGLTSKKLFCLISPNSFSCGNLVPCVFKHSNKVTLIGRTSAGGSCVVLPLTTAYGTFFQISGPQRLAFTKNGSFYDIDQGAEPDFALMFPESFYDRASLTEFINSIK